MTQVAEIFSNRYAIERPIARGGMADVFLAHDRLLDRPVAVKVLFAEYARDPSFVERFRREAQHAALLHHPNIVAVYDYGQERGTYFIVMEYVEGQSLRDLMRSHGPLSALQAARIASEIASALDFADRHGVVHRDIKPGNILLTPAGEVKVADFGISANPTDAAQGLTQTGAVIGTATYFSPEQAQGFPVDGRTDVYALGVVLYEMLAGRPPFSAETPIAVAMKHVREEPDAPSRWVADLPPDLETIALTALAKDTSERYQSADELRADLIRFGRGQPISVRAHQPAGSRPIDPAVRTVVAAPRPRPANRRPTHRKKRSGTIVTVILGALLATAVIGALLGSALGLFGHGGSSGPGTVEVPNVVGQTFAQASTALAKLGFKVVQVDAPSDSPIGQVTKQEPAVGVLLTKGGTVTLTVSGKQVTMPNLVGKTFEEAQTTLSGLSLTAARVEQTNPDKPAGTVLSTNPVAGTKIDKGSTVQVAVAAAAAVAVPSVLGQDQGAAQAALQAAGFTVTVVPADSDTVPSGKVIATDPAGGAMAPKGSAVKMSVSTGPKQVTVPNVVGQVCSSGASTLTSAGLNVVISGSASNPATAQNPAAGTQVPAGSAVTLTC
jgi:serine/threonine-protein kinase